MLSDRNLPEHIQLSQKLLDRAVSDAEKVESLVDCSILDKNRDRPIIKYLLSHRQPAFSLIASLLRSARGVRGKEIEIVLDSAVPKTPRTLLPQVHSERKRLRSAPFESGIMQAYNALAAMNGFRKVLVDSQGLVTRFAQAYTSGKTSAVFHLHASLSRDSTEIKVAAKIPYIHDFTSDRMLSHECTVLKILQSLGLERVVQLVGNGLCKVQSRDVLLLEYIDTTETDEKALELLNINDVRKIFLQVIETILIANSNKIFHHALDLGKILYEQCSGNVWITGWGAASMGTAEPPTKSKLWNSDMFMGRYDSLQ